MGASQQTQAKTRMTGAELIIRMLEQHGITSVSGIPGGAALPLYDALGNSRIRHILARHEQGAGFIAQGIARTTGKAAVCISSSGPGATNLMTAIADAKLDSVPLVCITAQVSSPMIGTDAFQEVDTYGMSIPITKHNYLVRNVQDLPGIIADAFRIAESGRPGPVWVDVPKDVQAAIIEIDELPPIMPKDPLPLFDAEKVTEAAAMINQAKRPILYIGGGIVASQSQQLVQSFAERAGLPTTMTLMGLGTIPQQHPLYLGMLGMHGARYTNMILQESDLLIVVGARFDDRAIGKVEQFCPDAKIIHVDIDRAEISKIKQPDIAINADAGQVLAMLLPQIEVNTRQAWNDHIAQIKQEFPLEQINKSDPLSHFGLIAAVADAVDNDAIITTDVGQHQMWVAQAYPLCRPRQWLTSGGLGTMGFGLPAAIGAALAEPSRKIVCFTGDGSIMMNIQEMATAAEHNLDIKIILMNNQALGMVHQQQTLMFNEHIVASAYPYQTDFVTIAKGFGLHTCDLNKESDPHAALQAAIDRPGPCLIHALIDVSEKVWPMVLPGDANIDMVTA
ncbi:acetolactate synthase large subunit [Morganella morganii subsp. morganii]|uniref:acetolactate synthase large subunit n=1 Tax=Morganella morganii TaxID=582 RepID=UPI000CE2A36B|nr:acetolactate synthase large subunit [Morganella morganii]AVD57943.1 acetolactate synthase catalytic subunit [Morganella morganii]MBT0429877.1 acetolactate synthase large subunit [Morganella morganii subsp. morganii]MBT0477551.1 acetolactate synthase large subunit [Morganella morganii subsp. morganii]MBT0502662.1 acetolactate synthase large subunit [Morganella morganii subsp. morganii]MBT0524598.1 acetolactate synthase large subunit [Morganella morganii subsp. morganii]